MTTHTNPGAFQAILSPEPAWRSAGFASGGLALVVTCAALLLCVRYERTARVVAARPAPRAELVVTLLDIPAPPAAAVALPDPSQPGAHASGAEPLAGVSSPAPKPKARAGKPTPSAAEPARRRDTVEPAEPAQPPTATVAAAAAQPTAAASSAPLSSVGVGEHSQGRSAGERGSGTGSASGAGTTQILPFMDGMTRPKLLTMIAPEYTREARDANVQGLFLAKCVITTAGVLQQCRVVKGLPLMDQAVLSALARWRYTPVVYQGKPVAVDYVIQVRLAGP